MKGKNITILLAVALFGIFMFYLGNSLNSEGSPTGLSFSAMDSAPIEKSINIAAIDNNGDGVLGKVNIAFVEGSGKVLVETNPFTEPDIQYSIEKASYVAQAVTQSRLTSRDLIVSFDVDGNLIGGGSAGAAMTSAIIAGILDEKIKEDVVVTGTIDLDGTIGSVGGLIEKMQAASEAGAKTFLIPKGQRYLVYYERAIEDEDVGNGFVMRKQHYVPKVLDLVDYGKTELNLDVKEVSNINDVVGYLFE